VRRVSVVGNSGSGKSTLSRALAARPSFVRVASGADAQRLLDSTPPLK
jgi:adenylate kinase family enzyme